VGENERERPEPDGSFISKKHREVIEINTARTKTSETLHRFVIAVNRWMSAHYFAEGWSKRRGKLDESVSGHVSEVIVCGDLTDTRRQSEEHPGVETI
jgi:hypothetical protein